jgi:hypothetical protein
MRRFHVLKLLDIDVNKPDPDVFKLEVERPLFVTCPDPDRGQFMIEPTTLRFGDLSGLYDQALKMMMDERAALPAGNKTSPVTFVAIQLLVAGILFSSYRVWRSQRRNGHRQIPAPADAKDAHIHELPQPGN